MKDEDTPVAPCCPDEIPSKVGRAQEDIAGLIDASPGLAPDESCDEVRRRSEGEKCGQQHADSPLLRLVLDPALFADCHRQNPEGFGRRIGAGGIDFDNDFQDGRDIASLRDWRETQIGAQMRGIFRAAIEPDMAQAIR
jgi:hypothetical protein